LANVTASFKQNLFLVLSLLQLFLTSLASFQAECNSAAQEPSRSPQHLNALLDVLLHPEKNIDDQVGYK
jgi:hypothetical protein